MLKTLLSHSVTEVSVEDVSDMVKEYVWLDARAKTEYNVSHIANATWIGYNEFLPERVATIPKDKPIMVYCSVGYRSEKIADKLLDLGFKNVQNLYGGMFEWVNEGLVVEHNGIPTNKVHPYDKIWGIWLNKGEKAYD